MTHFIIFDTETTDRWDFKGAWNASHQPHVVQLAYLKYNPKREEVKKVNLLINSSLIGCTHIEPGAEAVHGVSFDRMVAEGQDPRIVAQQLVEDFSDASYTIAHNNGFDMQVINCFLYRTGFAPNLFDGKFNLCTMKPLTNVLKIPSPNGRGYKWPKLDEAYRALINRNGFSGAHDAFFDTQACMEIFWDIWDKDIIKEYQPAKEHFNGTQG